MTATLLPNAEQQFCDADGKPFAGGLVFHYSPGTTTLKDTYQDAAGTILNQNPLVLNAAGRAIIFGTGDYRQILFDHAMNMIWDQLTSAPLPDDAISGVMAPVVTAATLQQARDLMGVTAAIQTAITAASLVGPTGPGGPTGPAGLSVTGPTGPQGPTGPAAGGSNSAILQTGQATCDINGVLTVTFPTPFPSLLTRLAVASIPDTFSGAYLLVGSFTMVNPPTVNGFSANVFGPFGENLSFALVSWWAMGL